MANKGILTNGFGDNQIQYQFSFSGSDIAHGLFMTHINQLPFNDAGHRHLIPASYLLSVGTIQNKTGRYSQHLSEERCIYEILAPRTANSPNLTAIVDPIIVGTCFETAFQELMISGHVDTMCEVDMVDYTAFHARYPGTPIIWKGQWTPAELSTAALTSAGMSNLLLLMCEGLRGQYTRIALKLILLMHISVAKRGGTTPAFFKKFEIGLTQDLGFDMDLRSSQPVAANCWRILSAEVDNGNVAALQQSWIGFLPAHAIRSRVTLEQMSMGGLTKLAMLARGYKKYPDFPWAVVGGYTGQMASATRALTTVGNDVWYGYRGDLGFAKSTHYEHLSWVAKELFRRLEGDGNIEDYKGWKNPPMKTEIVAVIEAYVTGYAARIINVPPAELNQFEAAANASPF